MIHLSIWLYGKPEWDLFTEEDGFINGDLFRGQADYLKEHLYRVADVVEKLKKNGWDCEGTLYTLELFKEDITINEAKKELRRLNISEEGLNLEEIKESLDGEEEVVMVSAG